MADFDYGLPDASIAQRPVEPRDSARLLVALGHDVGHRRVADLAACLRPGDLLVANDTRVLPARLHLRKATGGAAEVLLLAPCGPDGCDWEALVRPGRRLPPGTVLADDRGAAIVEIGPRTRDDTRRVRLLADPWAVGTIPLPPYVHEPLADPERYQTVYAAAPGSDGARPCSTLAPRPAWGSPPWTSTSGSTRSVR